MHSRSRIVTRFMVALLCFWMAGDRIKDKCGTGEGGCLGKLAWDDWMLIVVGSGLLSVVLFGLSRLARDGAGPPLV